MPQAVHSVEEVLAQAADRTCPAGLSADMAIAAHREAVRRRDLELCYFTLRTIALARMDGIADHVLLLRYLSDLPDGLWDGGTKEGLRARSELLEAISTGLRRQIH